MFIVDVTAQTPDQERHQAQWREGVGPPAPDEDALRVASKTGVIQTKSSWLNLNINVFIKNRKETKRFSLFHTGVNRGAPLTSP